MDRTNIDLTPAEWNLMECLWEAAPRTGREAVEYLKAHVGWSRSTTLTMLRRMTEKGLIEAHEAGGMLVYSPLIRREDAVLRETEGFLNRVYHGSLSLLLSNLTQKQQLSQAEIDELHSILHRAEEAKNDD